MGQIARRAVERRCAARQGELHRREQEGQHNGESRSLPALSGLADGQADIQVIYTPFPNLKVSGPCIKLATSTDGQKTGDMAVGQVSFHSDKKVKRVHVATRENAIVNRLTKTKVETEVDHESERQIRLKDEGRRKKVVATERVRRLQMCNSNCSHELCCQQRSFMRSIRAAVQERQRRRLIKGTNRGGTETN